MRIEGEFAVIETAEEAAAVYGWNITAEYDATGESWSRECTRKEALEAITPKEPDAVFWYPSFFADEANANYDDVTDKNHIVYLHKQGDVFKANALTIGKNVGKLRKLLAWCNS